MKRIILVTLGLFIINSMALANPLSIEQKIVKLNKRINQVQVVEIARAINLNSKKYKINSDVFITILMQESSFDQTKVSSTGDISIAQINYAIWSKEFSRRKLGKLNRTLLKTNITYAVNVMGIILSGLNNQYGKREKFWYTRYHSSNVKPRIQYANFLFKHSKLLAKNN